MKVLTFPVHDAVIAVSEFQPHPFLFTSARRFLVDPSAFDVQKDFRPFAFAPFPFSWIELCAPKPVGFLCLQAEPSDDLFIFTFYLGKLLSQGKYAFHMEGARPVPFAPGDTVSGLLTFNQSPFEASAAYITALLALASINDPGQRNWLLSNNPRRLELTRAEAEAHVRHIQPGIRPASVNGLNLPGACVMPPQDVKAYVRRNGQRVRSYKRGRQGPIIQPDYQVGDLP